MPAEQNDSNEEHASLIYFFPLKSESNQHPACAQTFVVGLKFKGVKMLPPGPHFVSCNATSGSNFAPTLGFFVHMAPRSVVVRRWDRGEELLAPIADPDEVMIAD